MENEELIDLVLLVLSILAAVLLLFTEVKKNIKVPGSVNKKGTSTLLYRR